MHFTILAHQMSLLLITSVPAIRINVRSFAKLVF